MSVHVLFVARKHEGLNGMAPFIKVQGESLQKSGLEVDYFLIKGDGLWAYFKCAFSLRKYIHKVSPDIIHAHYSLCGVSTVLAMTKIPKVISFMGSDILGEFITENTISFKSRMVILISKMIQPFFQGIISKAENIDQKINRKQKFIVPNGIDLKNISEFDKEEARKELGLKAGKTYIMFLGNPVDKWKNYKLAKQAVESLKNTEVELIAPYPMKHQTVFEYMKAVDVVLSTSFMEGSPNMIKEAMARNKPVVSTNVGDVKWLFGEVNGHFICDFDLEDVQNKLKLALEYCRINEQTSGIDRIIELQLDAGSVARKLEAIYLKILN